jgi:Ca2+-binding RTX toxin-like protein
LDNAGSSPLTFQLAEINSVRGLSLFGTGEASIIGNGFDNTLIGNEGSNWIDGRGGNDRLLGQGGDDDLYGGAGDDWLDGGDGFDRLMAGAGRDVLIAFDAQDDAVPAGATVGEVNGDVMLGGSGNDILIAMNSGSGFAPIRMMGGSGSDVFRISNPNGASGSVDQVNESIPQAVRAFIADLTPADGLDLSAIRTNAQGGGAITAIPAGTAVAGDYRVPLDGLFVAGLQSVLEATAGSAPIDPISEGSFLTAALVGPVEMNAALARSIPAPSTQDLVEQVLPSVYGPLDAFIDQLYV